MPSKLNKIGNALVVSFLAATTAAFAGMPVAPIPPGPLSQQAFTCVESGGTATAQYVPIAGSGRLPLYVTLGGDGSASAGAIIHVPNLPLGTLAFSVTSPISNFVVALGIDTSNGTPGTTPIITPTPTPNTIKHKTGSGGSVYLSINLASLIPSSFPVGTTLQGVSISILNVEPASSSAYIDQVTINGQSVPKITSSALTCPFAR